MCDMYFTHVIVDVNSASVCNNDHERRNNFDETFVTKAFKCTSSVNGSEIPDLIH